MSQSSDREEQRTDRALLDLLDRFGAPHPHPDATHYFGTLGNQLKWEQHTEFVTYTLLREGVPSARLIQQSLKPFQLTGLMAFNICASPL